MLTEMQGPGRSTGLSKNLKHLGAVKGIVFGLRSPRRLMPQDLHVPSARPKRVTSAPRQTADEVSVAEIFVSEK